MVIMMGVDDSTWCPKMHEWDGKHDLNISKRVDPIVAIVSSGLAHRY